MTLNRVSSGRRARKSESYVFKSVEGNLNLERRMTIGPQRVESSVIEQEGPTLDVEEKRTRTCTNKEGVEVYDAYPDFNRPGNGTGNSSSRRGKSGHNYT